MSSEASTPRAPATGPEAERGLLFIVSAPENLAKLDTIRDGNGKLADPRGVPTGEIERLTRELPVTVWLNYSIHGDESASFEAMMQVAYQLVAGDDSLTQRIDGYLDGDKIVHAHLTGNNLGQLGVTYPGESSPSHIMRLSQLGDGSFGGSAA